MHSVKPFVATNSAGNFPEVSTEISSGVAPTNDETQSRIVVTGSATSSPVTRLHPLVVTYISVHANI